MKKSKARSPTELDAIIGQKIREGRLLRDVSQEDLAAKIGITFQQLQKYENARNRVSASRLHLIARVLELPLAFFFGGQDIVPKKLDLRFDNDSVDLLRKFRPLSKPKRKMVRDLAGQLANVS